MTSSTTFAPARGVHPAGLVGRSDAAERRAAVSEVSDWLDSFIEDPCSVAIAPRSTVMMYDDRTVFEQVCRACDTAAGTQDPRHAGLEWIKKRGCTQPRCNSRPPQVAF
jgi:hypothetical protein